MILQVLKTAIRFMLRQKGYTLLNLLSLTIGIACAVLIMVYVRHELSYDRYHHKADRLFRVVTHVEGSSYPRGIAKVTGPWGLAIRENIPEIEDMTRFVASGSLLLGSGDLRFYEPNGFYADSSVFRMFSYALVRGDRSSALSEPNSIVLTSGLARKYFGDGDPLGRSIILENSIPLRVTGVMAEIPEASHFRFDYLISMGTLRHPFRDDWVRWNQFYTYVLLRPDVRPADVEAKIPQILIDRMGDEQGGIYKPFLQKMTSIHLHSNLFREITPNSDISYIYIMLAVGLFVLAIGCANFMNIATARVSTRAKEVGVRKAAGADRGMISRQFFGESIVLSLLSVPLAALIVEAALPAMNTVTNRHLSIDWLGDPELILAIVALATITGLVAGAYPALILASFRPIDVLKGSHGSARGPLLRRLLVIAQFTITTFFLVATGVVLDQVSYIRDKRLGFDKQDLLVVPMTDKSLAFRAASIKSDLLSHPSILRVSATANMPGGGDYGVPSEPVGIPKDRTPPMRILAGDADLLPLLGVELASGRMFSKDFASDTTSTYILNEEAARQLGWDDPLSGRIAMPAIDRPAGAVVGVVKDFHFRSMHEPIMPMLFFVPPPNWFSYFAVRVAPGRMDEAITALRTTFERYDPNHPFRFTYFDDQFDALHSAEERMSDLLTMISLLAVSLACLGLFGLVAYSTERRTKEVGIRKVLGASPVSIVRQLSKEFIVLVGIGNAIAWPLAYIAMRSWLSDFAYRTDIGIGLFLLTGGMTVLIAFLSVAYRSIRAASANPVDALRYE